MRTLFKILLAAALLSPLAIFADPTSPSGTVIRQVQDEGTGLARREKLNFTGAGVTCVDNAGNLRTDCTITSGGGGGASSLEVFNNFDGTRSSPTASIGLSDAFRGTVSGSTYTFRINFSSVVSRSEIANLSGYRLEPATVTPRFDLSAQVGRILISTSNVNALQGPMIFVSTVTGGQQFAILVSSQNINDIQTTAGIFLTPGSTAQVDLSMGGSSSLTVSSQATTINSRRQLRLGDSDNSNYAGFVAPTVLSTNLIWRLPLADSSGCLSSDGSGNLSITACGSGGSSPLEVFNNFDGTRSSPTASIGLSNAFRGTVSGSTYTFGVNFSSVASVSSLSSYATLAGTQTFTGQNTFLNQVTISTTIAGVQRIQWADGTVQVSSPAAGGGGGGTPGGSDTQLQYNNAGSFGGIATATFSAITNTLTIGATTIFTNVSTTTWQNVSSMTFNSGSALVMASGSNLQVPSGQILTNTSSVTVQGVITAGSNITLTPTAGILTISSSGGGAGDNLGNHIATMTLTANFGIISSTVVLTSPSATAKPLIVKGAAAQSGNLTEWQNSAGTALAYVDSAGVVNTNKSAALSGQNYQMGGNGAGQWWIDTSGNLFSSGNYLYSIGNTSQYTDKIYAGRYFAVPNNTAYVPMTIQGMASQAGNLTEWKNSAGVIVGTVTPLGGVSFSSGTFTNLVLPSLTSQNCIGTDSSGKAQAGSCSGGSGSSIYAATSTASFPFGFSSSTGVFTSTLTVVSSATVQGPMRIGGALTVNSSVAATTLSASSFITGEQLIAQGYSNGGSMVSIIDQANTSLVGPVYSGIGLKYQPADIGFPIVANGYFSVKTSTTSGGNSPRSFLVMGAGEIGNSGTTDYFMINISTSGTGQGDVAIAGHISIATNTATNPQVSACGTSPSIVGHDTAGKVTIGTGSVATSCTVTFGRPFTNPPACILNGSSSVFTTPALTTTTTGFVATVTSPFTASAVYNYICVGWE